MSLENVLDGSPREDVEQTEVVDHVEQADAVHAEDGHDEDQSAPTAQESDANQKHVPLAALEAERKQRQDYKERAARFEGELKAIKEQLERQSQPQNQEQQEIHPLESMQRQIINERFNTSEMIARSKYEDIDEKVNFFMAQAQANPALNAALHQQTHPWEFAYKEAKRMMAANEIGDDPDAYRAKVEAEIREKVLAEAQASNQSAPPRPNLPQSLAGARSAAVRSSPSFTGPTPLDQLLP